MAQDQSADQVTPDMVIEQMPQHLDPAKAGSTNATVQFDLSGDNGGKWWIKVHDGSAEAGKGEVENPNLTLLANADDYVKIALGQMDGTAAFMQGKLKIKGDMGLAIQLPTFLHRPAYPASRHSSRLSSAHARQRAPPHRRHTPPTPTP